MKGNKRSMSTVIFTVGAVLLVAYLGVVALVYFGQRSLQYFPDTTRRTPAEVGAAGFTAINLKAGSGENLVAWYKPAPANRPTILYFHGNGGSISTRTNKIAAYGKDFGLLATDYRGYGGNSGTPSETGIIADAFLAYDWLIAQGVKADDILLLGESLGSGVAVQLAAAKRVRAMALEAPYANIVDIGAERYWFLPVRLLMQDQFRSSLHIGKYRGPLFIIHGTADRVVPFKHGRKLFDLANEPKQFIEVEGAGHEMIGNADIWQRVLTFFEQHV
jgi:uncharacterized protein